MGNKISLEERFRRLEKGCPSDPEYVLCALKHLAQTPITVYLYVLDIQPLTHLLDLPLDALLMMNYREVAAHIVTMRNMPEHKQACDDAIALMAAPFYSSYLERRHLYPPLQTKTST